MKLKTLTYSMLAALVLAAPTLNAALLLQDNMNYGGSDIIGGASVTAGGWNIPSNRIVYRTGTNLTFTGDADYVNDPANASTGAFERTGGSLERVANRDYSDASLSGQFWMSTVITLTNPTSGYAGISLNTTATAAGTTFTGDVLGVGYNGSALAPMWFDDSASSLTYSGTRTLTSSSTVLMVAKLNIGAGADSFSMWVFDSASSFGLTEASLGTAHLTSITADFGDELDKIQLGGDPFQSYFDEIRISSLSGDNGLSEVLSSVPEPSAAILVGLGALLLLRRRRN